MISLSIRVRTATTIGWAQVFLEKILGSNSSRRIMSLQNILVVNRGVLQRIPCKYHVTSCPNWTWCKWILHVLQHAGDARGVQYTNTDYYCWEWKRCTLLVPNHWKDLHVRVINSNESEKLWTFQLETHGWVCNREMNSFRQRFLLSKKNNNNNKKPPEN